MKRVNSQTMGGKGSKSKRRGNAKEAGGGGGGGGATSSTSTVRANATECTACMCALPAERISLSCGHALCLRCAVACLERAHDAAKSSAPARVVCPSCLATSHLPQNATTRKGAAAGRCACVRARARACVRVCV